MSSVEFAEWMAYEQVAGPLGPERGDFHNARLLTLLHNLYAKKGQGKKVKDFLPEWDKPAQSPDQMLWIARTLNRAYGGEVDGDYHRVVGETGG